MQFKEERRAVSTFPLAFKDSVPEGFSFRFCLLAFRSACFLLFFFPQPEILGCET